MGRRFRSCLAVTLIGSMLLATPARGAGAAGGSSSSTSRGLTSSTETTADVVLGEGGRLTGAVYTPEGAPAAGVEVAFDDARSRRSGSAVTGPSGEFALTRMHSGVYSLSIGGDTVACRVWTRDAAPPAAVERLLVVRSSPTVRGQIPTRPILFLVPIAAAVGVYIAVKERERPNRIDRSSTANIAVNEVERPNGS